MELADLPSRWFTIKNKQVILHLHVFTVSTCPYCQKAETFLNDLALKNPWLDIHPYVINTDKQALITFNKFLQEQKLSDFSVPAIFFCDSRWVGFKDVEKSGAQLLAGLNYCHEQLSKTYELSPTTVTTLKQMALANWFAGGLRTTPSSSSSFVLLMAFIDALNPSVTLLVFTFIAFLISLLKQGRQLMGVIAFILGADCSLFSVRSFVFFLYCE